LRCCWDISADTRILPAEVHTDCGTHPASYWVPLALSPAGKGLEFEAGLSPPYGGKVKDKFRYTFTSCTFMVYK